MSIENEYQAYFNGSPVPCLRLLTSKWVPRRTAFRHRTIAKTSSEKIKSASSRSIRTRIMSKQAILDPITLHSYCIVRCWCKYCFFFNKIGTIKEIVFKRMTNKGMKHYLISLFVCWLLLRALVLTEYCFGIEDVRAFLVMLLTLEKRRLACTYTHFL